MKFFFICLFSVILFACTSPSRHADRAPSGNQSLVQIPEELSADLLLIEKYLRPRMQILNREILTFHYESDEFQAKSLAQAQARIEGWTERYFDPKITGGGYEVGPGEYTAVDSASSREFGQRKPKLYILPLVKGARVLNLAYGASTEEKSDLERLFIKDKCQASSTVFPENIAFLIGDMRRSETYDSSEIPINCRKLIVRAAQDLNVEAILFPYPGSDTLMDCRHQRKVAFDIVRNSAIDFSRLAYFDDEQKFNGDELSRFMPSLYKEAALDITIDGKSDEIAELASWGGPNVSADEYRRWKAGNLYQCGPPLSLETNSLNNPTLEKIISGYEDRSLVLAMAHFRDVYRMKTKDSGFNPLRLNAIEELLYSADRDDGVSFEIFKEAQDSIQIGSEFEGFKKAAELLGEQATLYFDYDVSQAVDQVIKIKGQRPFQSNLLAKAYLNLHFGPRLLRLAVSLHLLAYGAPPLIKGNPLSPKAVEESRILFMQILKECTAAYLDPTQRPETIQTGHCGMRGTKN